MQERRLDDVSPNHFGGSFDLFKGYHRVNLNSTSGSRPDMISANALPDPAAMVQPSVPWPVLRYRFSKRVRPMSGTLDGVEGRSPVQNVARSYSPAPGKSSLTRRVSASQRTMLRSVE